MDGADPDALAVTRPLETVETGRSRGRELIGVIVKVVVALVVPMILLGATVAPHVEGCGGG